MLPPPTSAFHATLQRTLADSRVKLIMARQRDGKHFRCVQSLSCCSMVSLMDFFASVLLHSFAAYQSPTHISHCMVTTDQSTAACARTGLYSLCTTTARYNEQLQQALQCIGFTNHASNEPHKCTTTNVQQSLLHIALSATRAVYKPECQRNSCSCAHVRKRLECTDTKL